MEKRTDLAFRQVVDRLLPALLEQGFGLSARGMTQDDRWVELERPAAPGHDDELDLERLRLYHLPNGRYLGALVTGYVRGQRAEQPRVAYEKWIYDSDGISASDIEDLVQRMHTWVHAHLSC